MSGLTIKTLICTLIYPNRASYYDDWCDAFVDHPRFDCSVANIIGMKPKDLAKQIEDFDAIIMLHACNSDTLDYLKPLAPVLGQRKRARLVTFVGNEFNSPYVSMTERTQLFAQSRCDLVATQLLQEAGDYLYSASGARVIAMPHALNPAVFRPGPGTRAIDIGVKGYLYPPYLGDDDRNRFLNHFACEHGRWDLKVDVSVDKRLVREDWAKFLRACHATITTETGSWYIAPDDELIGRVYAYLDGKRKGPVIRNSNPLRRMARMLPSALKGAIWEVLKHGPVRFEVLDDYNTPFEELDELFYRHVPRAPVYSKAISSRHFDAIGSTTCQIALRGRFNDILVADEHYLAVDADYGNIDEVIDRFRDRQQRDAITVRALDHVMTGHTYRHRVDDMFEILSGLA
jgi:Glycosyl transferases group 1